MWGSDYMNVVLYSTGCPKCNILKKKLTEKNISYTENQNVEEMIALNINEVPVLSVDGELMNFGNAVKWVNSQ